MKRSRGHEEDLDSDSRSVDAKVDIRPPVAKITGLDPSGNNSTGEENRGRDSTTAMKCSLPPHREPIVFKTYDEYEAHYFKYHTNRCLECRKNFPSEHLLGIHIEECHDPLVRVRRDKGEHTFSCFVEGCERKCLTHQKRRMHMIDKHMYPKNYYFAVTKDGIDGRRSLLNETGHRRRSSTSTQTKESRRRASLQGATNGQRRDSAKAAPKPTKEDEDSDEDSDEEEEEEEEPDTQMEDLAGAMSSLQFIPPSVRFGRQRAGFSKR